MFHCIAEHSDACIVLPCTVTPFVRTPPLTFATSIAFFPGWWHAVRYYV